MSYFFLFFSLTSCFSFLFLTNLYFLSSILLYYFPSPSLHIVIFPFFSSLSLCHFPSSLVPSILFHFLIFVFFSFSHFAFLLPSSPFTLLSSFFILLASSSPSSYDISYPSNSLSALLTHLQFPFDLLNFSRFIFLFHVINFPSHCFSFPLCLSFTSCPFLQFSRLFFYTFVSFSLSIFPFFPPPLFRFRLSNYRETLNELRECAAARHESNTIVEDGRVRSDSRN